nr:ABC transporter ATP-binding protein [Calderihabitans maritimus]
MLVLLKDIVKAYNEIDIALKGVSLEVAKGEFVAIMGPSGSGKSTLMHIIGCLDRPTSGSYLLEGQDIAKLDDNQLAYIRSRKIGFVFQNFQLLSRATAVENVELPMIYLGLSPRQRKDRAKELLHSVGLGHRLYHYPHQLSGGEKQRVAIARALVNDPALILADEPTGNLDTRSGNEVLEIFQKLHQQGTTIVLVTHDREVASRAERTVLIRDGEIIANHLTPDQASQYLIFPTDLKERREVQHELN